MINLTVDEALWLGSFIAVSFFGNVAILALLFNDKMHRPGRIAGAINLLWMFVSGLVIVFLVGLGLQYAGFNAGVSGMFLLGVIALSRRRDRDAVEFGESFIEAEHAIDTQVNFIFHLVLSNDVDSIAVRNAVDNCLSFILDEISRSLGLDPQADDSHISLLSADSGRFKVLAHKGVRPERIPHIEEKFRYGKEVVSVAGRAATSQTTIYVPDLEDDTDDLAKDWIPLTKDERKQGSIISLAILRGVGSDGSRRTLAVLSVTSKRTHAFDQRTATPMLLRINEKIQTTLFILETLERFEAGL